MAWWQHPTTDGEINSLETWHGLPVWWCGTDHVLVIRHYSGFAKLCYRERPIESCVYIYICKYLIIFLFGAMTCKLRQVPKELMWELPLEGRNVERGAMSWPVCHWKGNLDASGSGPQLLDADARIKKNGRSTALLNAIDNWQRHQITIGSIWVYNSKRVPNAVHNKAGNPKVPLVILENENPHSGVGNISLNIKQWLTSTKRCASIFVYIYIYIYIYQFVYIYTDR